MENDKFENTLRSRPDSPHTVLSTLQLELAFVSHQPSTRRPNESLCSRPFSFKLGYSAMGSLVLAFALGWGVSPAMAQATDPVEFFEKQIRPVLAENCHVCHNPETNTAELDLTTAQGFQTGGQSGPLVSPENLERSRILEVIRYEGQVKMPPTGKLGAPQIAALTDWVKRGAHWPGTEERVLRPSLPSRTFTEEEREFWAFQPVREPQLPRVKDESWIASPIDRFVLAKLEASGLEPAPPADKLTLLRRATFDLTGLPPTESEIVDFLTDDSRSAFEKVVDRLLASPRYGERWARHWFDVARYADSSGNDEDHRYPYAWRYRDYVIEAFNSDMPYDRFIREQLAGDLLPAHVEGEINRQGIIATGFLALGQKAVAQQDKTKMLYDVYDEQLDLTSRALLGLSVTCARCHDHKFDPIRTRDYYSLISIFASTKNFIDPQSHVTHACTFHHSSHKRSTSATWSTPRHSTTRPSSWTRFLTRKLTNTMRSTRSSLANTCWRLARSILTGCPCPRRLTSTISRRAS